MDDLVPFNARDAAIDTRNTTEMSLYANRIVELFCESDLEVAKLEDTGTWPVRDLYKCVWQVCTKKKYRSRVNVHMRLNKIVLVKKGVS